MTAIQSGVPVRRAMDRDEVEGSLFRADEGAA